MGIKAKFIILISLISVIFLSVFMIQRSFEQERLISLLGSERHQRTTFFEGILKLEGTSLSTFVYDYTYWDEMVEFVATRDMTWGADNIGQSLDTYNASAVWVFDPNFSLVYAVNNLGEEEGFEAMPPVAEVIPKLFEKSRFCYFFINTPRGLLEVRGATIHPSNDVERQTDIRGYFFAGRLWDEQYINGLSELTGQRIAIVLAAQTVPPSSDAVEGKYTISYSRVLSGWDGKILATLTMLSESRAMKNFDRISRQISFMFIICMVMVLLVILIGLTHWISIPLWSITAALKENNPAHIDRLRHEKAEFGNIARLIKQFFEQKEVLLKEISERKKAEGALKEKESYLKIILDSLQVGIVIIDSETHIIVEANPAAVRMIGADRGGIIGKPCYRYICPAEKGKCPVSDLGQNIEGSERILLKGDGSMIPILKTITLITLNDRKCLLESFMDITDRKKAEERQKALLKNLEDTNKIMVGRELKMIELKKEVNKLSLELGRQSPYEE
ncbi:MAG: CHASE4 domain-containing protein [Candidatus Omnitrophota bacterium]|jgi:PAS domain S-box-containing protein